MDLNTKAQWHLDFNGGMVPVLETPSGILIKESQVIMNVAHDLVKTKQSGTHLLWPEDPIDSALMRLRMEDFSKICPPVF